MRVCLPRCPNIFRPPPGSWGKNRRIRSLAIVDSIAVIAGKASLLLVRIEYTTGDPEEYCVPLTLVTADHAGQVANVIVARVRFSEGTDGLLIDGSIDPETNTALLEAFAKRKRLRGERGSLLAQRNRQFRKIWGSAHPDLTPVPLPSAEVNSTVRFGDRFVLKVLRRVEPGPHPGVEMGRRVWARSSERVVSGPLCGRFGVPI